MASRASSATIEQIRQASDIVDVVSAYVSLKRSGRGFKGLCPFHKEKTPSFSVVPDKQIFHCFGCGAGGDVFKFVQMRENVDFPDALSILARRAGIDIEETQTDRRGDAGPTKSEIERANRWAVRWFAAQYSGLVGSGARGYVDERGINADSVERFMIGYAPGDWESLVKAAAKAEIPRQLLSAAGLTKPRDDGSAYDAFRNRLIFPIVDTMNRVLGFGGRTLGDDAAKYLNSPQSLLFDKGRCLYGMNLAKEAFARQRTAVVVEGYTDCILAHQHGFANTVATLGTALTPAHVQLLRRYVDEVILVFDSDAAGQKAADASLAIFLGEGLDVRLAAVPEAKDPAELLVSAGSGAFAAVLTSAMPALEFKWKQVSRQYHGATTGPDRRRAVEDFLRLIAGSADLGSCDPIQRGLILNQVGKLLGLAGDEIGRQLRIVARQTPDRPATAVDVAPRLLSRAQSSAAAAMQTIVEALLNEPALYAEIEDEYDPALLPDDELRQIAAVFAQLSQEQEEFNLARFIGRFESVSAARLITALHAQGEDRGNHQATIADCRRRLRELRELREAEDIVAGIRSGAIGVEQASAAATAHHEALQKLQAIGAAAGKRSNFAARRHLAAPPTAGARPGNPQDAE